jgi:elongation factor 1-beta
MADVIVTFKVLPEDVSVDLTQLEIKIRDAVDPDGFKREPIAFGLVALIVTKMIPDAGGELEKVEKKLREVGGVGEVEVIEVARSL